MKLCLKRRWYNDGGLNGGATFVQMYANHQYNRYQLVYLNNAWHSLLEMKIKPITSNVWALSKHLVNQTTWNLQYIHFARKNCILYTTCYPQYTQMCFYTTFPHIITVSNNLLCRSKIICVHRYISQWLALSV